MELVIDDDENFYLPEEISGVFTPRFDNDKIAQYLNNKLYTDPEFFGDFGPENIESIREFV